MANAYQVQPKSELRAAILRAGGYLQRDAVSRVAPNASNLLAVWSRPEVNHGGRPILAKLGGSGLGLVALLSIEEIEPGFTPLSTLQGLGRFIVFMQKKDGSFYSKYLPTEGGRNDDWVSLFYPGEAALGLFMLHEKDPKGKWAVPATRALEFLAESRVGQQNIPSDHWALLATAKLFELEKVQLTPELKQLLVDHSVQICEAILAAQVDGVDNPLLDGAFDKQGQTSPAATRLEGLIAAKKILPADHPLQRRMDACLERGIRFLLRSQIKSGAFYGAIPLSVDLVPEGQAKPAGYNRRSTEVRIDYVQHALSAFLGWERMKAQ